ncbi:MAG TPA: hypothetical protein VK654_02140, partial [Nitrospirota bacterium]|nr:hypothetical protein [Nitrospirota bacterium]
MKITLTNKLYGMTGLMLLIVITITVSSFVGQQGVQKYFDDMIDGDAEQQNASMEAKEYLGLAIQASKNYLIRGDEDSLIKLRDANKRIDAALAKYEKAAKDDIEHQAVDKA